MFSEFKQAVENISNSSDILEVMFLFYFDKKTFTWYKHLIDNRTSQKNQTQLGILYDMEQSFICRELQKVQMKIKKYMTDLDRNRYLLINILNYIDKYTNEHQKLVLSYIIQRKSYSQIAKLLGVSRQAVHCCVSSFYHKISKQTDQESILFKNQYKKLLGIEI